MRLMKRNRHNGQEMNMGELKTNVPIGIVFSIYKEAKQPVLYYEGRKKRIDENMNSVICMASEGQSKSRQQPTEAVQYKTNMQYLYCSKTIYAISHLIILITIEIGTVIGDN